MGLALGLLVLLSLPTYRALLGFSLNLRAPLDNLLAQVDALAYLFSRPLILLQVNIDPEPVRCTRRAAQRALNELQQPEQ